MRGANNLNTNTTNNSNNYNNDSNNNSNTNNNNKYYSTIIIIHRDCSWKTIPTAICGSEETQLIGKLGASLSLQCS